MRIRWLPAAAALWAMCGCAGGGSSGSTLSTVSTPHSILVTWDASESSVAGYYVFRATDETGPYFPVGVVAAPSLQYTDTSVQGGFTYYYTIIAVAADASESLPSDVVTVSVPGP